MSPETHQAQDRAPGRGCPPIQKSEALRNFGSIDITASTALNFPKDRQRIAIKQHLGSIFRNKTRTVLVVQVLRVAKAPYVSVHRWRWSRPETLAARRRPGPEPSLLCWPARVGTSCPPFAIPPGPRPRARTSAGRAGAPSRWWWFSGRPSSPWRRCGRGASQSGLARD